MAIAFIKVRPQSPVILLDWKPRLSRARCLRLSIQAQLLLCASMFKGNLPLYGQVIACRETHIGHGLHGPLLSPASVFVNHDTIPAQLRRSGGSSSRLAHVAVLAFDSFVKVYPTVDVNFFGQSNKYAMVMPSQDMPPIKSPPNSTRTSLWFE